MSTPSKQATPTPAARLMVPPSAPENVQRLVEAAQRDMETELSGLQFKDVKIARQGEQIILPPGMSYSEGRLWLSRQEEAEEKIISIHHSIPCFPLDGVIALRRALEQRYGFVALANTETWFGPILPTMVEVETARGKYEPALIGRIQPPLLEGGFISTNAGEMALIVKGEIKKKFESEVHAILDGTKAMLEKASLYRGNAIRLDLQWMLDGDEFNPVKHAPVFINTDIDESSLILNRDTMAALNINIFTLIENTEACRRNGIPLKHGCILVGEFGTGKTMTATITAKKAVRNHWTYIYLKTPRAIAKALRLAEMYAPAVLFTEDIDGVVSEDRNDRINEILNTLDGVDTKDKPIITVLTTNNVENINPALLRPGRMDTVVQFTAPNAESALRFIDVYGKGDDNDSLIAPMTDEQRKQVGAALAGYVPAFISEAVQKAKRLAIAETGSADIVGKVTWQHLIDAADVLRSHRQLMERKTEKSHAEQVLDAVTMINEQ